LVVALLIFAAHNAYTQPWALDDAFITFRYAENFAAGHGPVYNVGERVEGYTTPLWMAMLAVAHALGIPTLVAAKTLGTAMSVATLATLAMLHRLVPGVRARESALACLLVGTCGVFSRWSMSGMEVGLVTLLVLWTLVAHLRGRAGGLAMAAAVGLLGALAVGGRPDAALVVFVVGLDRLWGAVRGRTRWRDLFVFVGVFVALYGPYFALRWHYYGWPLPNTFYVKVGATTDQLNRGLTYVFEAMVLLWPMALATVVGAIRGRWKGLGVLVAVLGLHTAYVVAVGGDVFWGYRFFSAMTPLLGWVTASVLVRAALPASWRTALVGLALIFNVQWMVRSGQLHHIDHVVQRGAIVGSFLEAHAPEDALLAANIAGSLAYYAKLNTLDTLGLNDTTIAHRRIESMGRGIAGHEKGDGAYVLSRAPDYVVFASSLGARRPRFLGDRELFAHPEFRAAYELHHYDLDGWTFRVWVRSRAAGGAGLLGVRPSKVDSKAFTEPFETRQPDDGADSLPGEGQGL